NAPEPAEENRQAHRQEGPGRNHQDVRLSHEQRLGGGGAPERQVFEQAIPNPPLTANQPMPTADHSQVAKRVDLAQPPLPAALYYAFRTVGKRAIDVYRVPFLNPTAGELRGHHGGRLALGRVYSG